MADRRTKEEKDRDIIAILTGDGKIGRPSADDRNELDVNGLVPFTDHPFKLYEGERLDDMVRSIRENGIIVPIIVRPAPNADKGIYEILSGHNRVKAGKIAGLIKVPIIVREDLTEYEARRIVIETNLIQRSFADLAHSERAIVLKAHMDTIREQGVKGNKKRIKKANKFCS